MSKIETASKLSLKLTSRIKLGRRGARAELSLWTQTTSTTPSTARKGPTIPPVNATKSGENCGPGHTH